VIEHRPSPVTCFAGFVFTGSSESASRHCRPMRFIEARTGRDRADRLELRS